MKIKKKKQTVIVNFLLHNIYPSNIHILISFLFIKFVFCENYDDNRSYTSLRENNFVTLINFLNNIKVHKLGIGVILCSKRNI